MKKIILIALLLTGLSTQAQYFQHEYGYSAEIGTVDVHGQNTRYVGSGHLIGGHFIDIFGKPIYSADFGILAAHTDADGRFTGINDFNNHYIFNDGNPNYKLRITSAQVVEFEDGSGYGAIGAFHRWQNIFPPSAQIVGQGIAYIRLDATGAVTAIQGYDLSNVVGTRPFVTGLREADAGNGDLFATGTNGDGMWAMRINQNGAIVWANTYPIGCNPHDIIESPYTNDVIIIGNYGNGAFWMKVDPATGAFTSFDVMSSFTGATIEQLISIDISADPSMPGFILAGDLDGRAWVTKTDQTGNMQWSGRYWSATSPSRYMRGYDAVGRLKDNDYEYYVTGPYWTDPYDGNAVVFKLDRNGNPMNPNGLFIYDYGFEETGNTVDVNTSGSGDGVTMYAIKEDNPNARKEAYVVKAYFNGVSGCNEKFEDLDRDWAEFFSNSTLSTSPSSFGTTTIYIDHIAPNIDNELCHSASLSDGNNDRKAADKPKGSSDAIVSPNPMQQGAEAVVVEVVAETPSNVNVAIYDMLGRNYYTGSFTLAKGNNQLPLTISDANMAAGMYTIKLTGTDINKTIMLLVK